MAYKCGYAKGYLDNCRPMRLPRTSSNGRLGCAINEAFITGRGGSPILMGLTGADSIDWDRRLDDTSQAQVVVKNNSECCDVIADVEPWCHELHIKRGEEEVWVGPVTEVLYNFDNVTIKARDMTFWLTKRVAEVDIDNSATGTGIPLDIVTIAQNVLTIALIEDDPGILPYVLPYPSGLITQRKMPAYTDNAFNQLQSLADTGLNYTAVCRTIILGGTNIPLAPIATLTDSNILSDVTLIKSGLLQGNRYFVHFDNDLNSPAMSEVAKQCYGLLEEIRHGNDNLPGFDDAKQVATTYVNFVGTAPRLLDMGSEAKLSPDTPWTISEMIPGARVDVALSRLCIDVFQSFKLSSMQVKQSFKGEEVSIKLGDISITGNLL